MIDLSNITLWEAVAALQLAQSTGIISQAYLTTDLTIDELCKACGGGGVKSFTSEKHKFGFDAAYRRVDTYDGSYLEALAEGEPMQETKPLVVAAQPTKEACIVVCPWPIKKEFELHRAIWTSVTKFLRTYSLPVYLLGEETERQDTSMYYENEILSKCSVKEKLEYLASAQLVVGVPNAWVWLAASMQTKLILLYPEAWPARRWFWQDNDNVRRVIYDSRNVQTPVVLAALRSIIKAF